MDLSAIDLADSRNYVAGVPHEWFAQLRADAPVWWHEEPDGPGFWAVTRHADCVAVNRDPTGFSSHRGGVFIWDMPEEQLQAQRMMMLNMDPPLHTRYRALVNKGFTPRMVAKLEEQVHAASDDLLDRVCAKGSADFVTDIAAELPLVVIADLLGVPYEDRHQLFDWSNRLIGSEDPEYAVDGGADRADEDAGHAANQDAAMEVYAYASELYKSKRAGAGSHEDLMTVLTEVEIDGEKLSDLELELFFLLLIVAGNETTRNLVSGAMAAFFESPQQWHRLAADPSLLPTAVEEMLRFVTPVMNFRRQATTDGTLGGQRIREGEKVVFFHTSANRDETVFDLPNVFDVGRSPNPHVAFGGGGPHFCLGANLARLEIRVIFEHLLTRMPDIAQDGPVERLRSQFINGVKHLPVAFTPSAPVNAAARKAV